MGKYIKTAQDDRFINSLALEVYKLDPTNAVLNTLMNLPNFEGGELRKTIKEHKRTDCFHFFRYMPSSLMKRYVDKIGENISPYPFRVESSLSHFD